jgi:hypothetical protein
MGAACNDVGKSLPYLVKVVEAVKVVEGERSSYGNVP